jgi:thiol-disulfide isomerase/thioredoxin
MSYHSLSSFSELTLQDPVTVIHPTIMKGIRPTSRSQPNHDVLQFIDPSNIEQDARDSQDQRNQDFMQERRKENYSKQVEVASDHSFMEEKQKFMEEKQKFMEEQKRMMEEQKRMMEEQKRMIEEKHRIMELEVKLKNQHATYQGAKTIQSTGTTGFSSLTDQEIGFIKLNSDDVESIMNKIKEDGNNKITSFIWFYADWCGFCTRLIPAMEEVGRGLKDYRNKVNLYLVDADNKPAIMSTFNVRGFPTLNVYHGQPGVPTVYSGDRSASDMINFLKLEMNK